MWKISGAGSAWTAADNSVSGLGLQRHRAAGSVRDWSTAADDSVSGRRHSPDIRLFVSFTVFIMAKHLASIFGTGKDRVNCPSPSPATSSPRGHPELFLPRLHRAGGKCRSTSWLTVNSTVRYGRSRVKVSDGLGMGIRKTVWVTLRAALVGRDGQQ